MPGLTTPNNTQAYLVDLDIYEIALCKEGANTRADILLTKSKKGEPDMPKTFEEIIKALNPEEATVINDLIKAKDTSITTITGQLEEAKKAKPPVEPQKPAVTTNPMEELLKSATPELVNYIKGLQTSVDTLVKDQAESLAKARFEAVKAIPCDEAKMKEVLKSASPAVYELLKTAAETIEKTTLGSKGVAGSNEGLEKNAGTDNYDILDKAAKELMKSHPEKTYEQCFADATIANPEAYAKYVKEGR